MIDLENYGTTRKYKTIDEWFKDNPIAEREVSMYMSQQGGTKTLRWLKRYFKYPFKSRSALLTYAEERQWIWNEE